jgi:Na+-transporting methylmalonyl-CoA/oxaloacetate decarboxylase gamma subunit
LKATVIGLGIVFLGLATLLIVLIMTGGPKRTASSTAAPRPVAVEDLEFTIPRNSRVAEVFATGNHIVLRVRLADGTERLYALDGETLKPLGSITVKVEK